MRSIFFIRHSSLCVHTMASLLRGQVESHHAISVKRTNSRLGGLELSPYTFDCKAQIRQSIFGLPLAWETPDPLSLEIAL
jgi:hypothetical protein